MLQYVPRSTQAGRLIMHQNVQTLIVTRFPREIQFGVEQQWRNISFIREPHANTNMFLNQAAEIKETTAHIPSAVNSC